MKSKNNEKLETQTGEETDGYDKEVTPYQPSILRRIRHSKAASFGLVIIIGLILMALLAPVLAPYDPLYMDFFHAKETPSWEHWLGTDEAGRDILSRLLYGAQISIFIGCTAIVIGLGVGVILGLFAGFYGGFTDNLIMRSLDILMAFPGIMLALIILAFFGGGLINVPIVIGIVMIPGFSRILRSQVLSITELEYVSAARSIGISDLKIMFRHILPNCLGPLLVIATLGMGGAIMADAGLSFLGLGVNPPMPTWGRMIQESFDVLQIYPHITLAPCIAIMITVLGFNMAGDGFRDVFDPKLQE